MDNYIEILDELKKQEDELQFESFSSDAALEIGMSLIRRADSEKKAVAIDIERNGRQLFHFAFDGTSPDNDEWIRGKVRAVLRFEKSSYRIGIGLRQIGKTLEEKYYLSSSEYRTHGGSFPIRIRGTGVIGAITVSGLAQEEDHAMVVDAIRQYLGKSSGRI